MSSSSSASIEWDNYRFLQKYVYSRAGIVLEDNKHYLFESRLAPILQRLGLDTINDLCVLLRESGEVEVGHRVVEAMTTNETYFFREPAQYEAIRTTLLPRLKEESQYPKKLRFWSAAASTGQEAYSLAMLLLEQGLAEWDLEILGTDISTHVLERARSGRYQQIEVNRGLPAPLLRKYFTSSGLDWQLNDEVRRMVRYEAVDLRESMRSRRPFDLVFCRNVMIYFDAETKTKILRELRGVLGQGGWLLLGGSEPAFGAEEWFERQFIGGATVFIAR